MTKEDFKAALAVIGWSQSECARKTGLTDSTVSRYATGEAEVPEWLVRHLAAMADIAQLYDRYVVPERRRGRGRPAHTDDGSRN